MVSAALLITQWLDRIRRIQVHRRGDKSLWRGVQVEARLRRKKRKNTVILLNEGFTLKNNQLIVGKIRPDNGKPIHTGVSKRFDSFSLSIWLWSKVAIPGEPRSIEMKGFDEFRSGSWLVIFDRPFPPARGILAMTVFTGDRF